MEICCISYGTLLEVSIKAGLNSPKLLGTWMLAHTRVGYQVEQGVRLDVYIYIHIFSFQIATLACSLSNIRIHLVGISSPITS